VLALLLAAVAASAQEKAPEKGEEAPERVVPAVALQDTWYAQALAYSDRGINVTHFWSKGPWLRADTVIAGHRVATLVRGDTYYAYDLTTRRGLAIQRSDRAIAQDAERVRPFGNEAQALERLGGEKIGTDQLGGREVDVVQITDALGKRQVWVSKDAARLPIRLKVFRRGTGKTLHTDFLNWKRGMDISDTFFQPEPDVELVRVGFDEYLDKQKELNPVGPVPVLYTDLLHGH